LLVAGCWLLVLVLVLVLLPLIKNPIGLELTTTTSSSPLTTTTNLPPFKKHILKTSFQHSPFPLASFNAKLLFFLPQRELAEESPFR